MRFILVQPTRSGGKFCLLRLSLTIELGSFDEDDKRAGSAGRF
jgi:hypothetical protein